MLFAVHGLRKILFAPVTLACDLVERFLPDSLTKRRQVGRKGDVLLAVGELEACREEMRALYDEMAALETQEAQIYKALDKLEAVIQHNESDIATWLPREYELNLTYADENVAFSDYLKRLREEIRRETRDKIAAAEHNRQ